MFYNDGKLTDKGFVLIRIILSLVLLFATFLLNRFVAINDLWWLFLYIPIYLFIGYEVIFNAFKNLFKGAILDENFLMTIASISAFAIGAYAEAIAVMIFYQIGELFQDIATDKSRKNVTKLIDMDIDYCNLLKDNIEIKEKCQNIAIGDRIIIKSGEKVPLDCIVLDGESTLNTFALTGESLPREVKKGSEILSGSINEGAVLTCEVLKTFENSTANKIKKFIEDASFYKSKQEKFITKFAKYYTPIVVVLAFIIAIVPPIFLGEWDKWIKSGISFLVVSCPCALVISVPLSYFATIGVASKKGILIKGGSYIEKLAECSIVAFDKTGTITKGKFSVVEVNAIGILREELLKICAIAESFSNHPIARAISGSVDISTEKNKATNVEELSGYGIKCEIAGDVVLVGNDKLLKKYGVNFEKNDNNIGSVCYIAINNIYSGNIVVADTIKDSSINLISLLSKLGINNTYMLTGDSKVVADSIAREAGITNVKAELLPQDKLIILEEIIEKNKKGTVAFIGDGINDAPALKRADVSIAMGGAGSDIAIECSDIVITEDDMSKVAESIDLSKKTKWIALENIIFCIGIKFIVLLLSLFGFASIWLAVFADVGVAILAILNSMRIFLYKGLKK